MGTHTMIATFISEEGEEYEVEAWLTGDYPEYNQAIRDQSEAQTISIMEQDAPDGTPMGELVSYRVEKRAPEWDDSDEWDDEYGN